MDRLCDHAMVCVVESSGAHPPSMKAVIEFASVLKWLLVALFLCDSAKGAENFAAETPPLLMTFEKQQELFDALDLSSDALKPVAMAVAKGDFSRAEGELAAYFRHRTNVPWSFDPHHLQQNLSFKDPVAEDAVKGRLQGGLVMYWNTFPDNKIDWLYNETLVAPNAAKNPEWQWQLCRMDFWSHLAKAYRATGDERFAHAWIEQFHSFNLQCPPPDHMDNSHELRTAWRTIEAGIRMSTSWPTAYFSFLLSPQFTDDDVALFLHSCLSHARFLKKFNTRGNWLTMEMAGLYSIGAIFPEFKEAKDWRESALTRMAHEETAQFLPDGAQNELSTMYHNVALDNFVNIARRAKLVGRLNELPDGYTAGLEKAFDFDLFMMTPDRSIPEFNDSTSWPKSVVRRCTDALEFFPSRTDFQWVASDGKEGHPPVETSKAFPWAGYYVMRNGWDLGANYLAFRAGPLGLAHAHQDKLNVVLWSNGRRLLFNSGGASYEQSKWRSYSVDTFSKNTILVDGKAQSRDRSNREKNISKAPIDARWESTPDHDFAAGVYDEGYGSVDTRLATHTRRVLFLKPDLFVIADTLVPSDEAEHTYQARWNLLTTKSREDEDTHAVTTIDENQPNLTVIPLELNHLEVRCVSGQTEPELLGWNVRKDVIPAAVPATTVVHSKKGSGPQTFLTLLIPIGSGNSSPVKSITPIAPASAAVKFNDGHVLSIVVDPKPNGGIEAIGPVTHVKIPAAAAFYD